MRQHYSTFPTKNAGLCCMDVAQSYAAMGLMVLLDEVKQRQKMLVELHHVFRPTSHPWLNHWQSAFGSLDQLL